MTEISRDEVEWLAQLSSLRLEESEIDPLRKDISNILNYINQLNELDTNGVDPTYQVTDLQNVMRDDVIGTDDVSHDALLGLAPDTKDGSVKVPKVL